MISIFLVIGYWLLAKNCGTLFTTSSFISDLITCQNKMGCMNIKYNHVNLSKISLALIYSLLDMINSPNSNTSCTNQSNLFLEFIRTKRVWMSRSFGAFFFTYDYFFSLYANRLQILHKHCFQFLLALTIAPIRDISKLCFCRKKMCRSQVACRDVDKPSSWLVCSISFSFRMGSCNFKSGIQVPTHWSSRFV